MKRFLIFLAVVLTTIALTIFLMWVGGGEIQRGPYLRDCLMTSLWGGIFLGLVVQTTIED